MNTNEKINAFLNRYTSGSHEDNVYESEPTKKALRIAHTVYPNGAKQMSLNGKDEWYGIQQTKQLNN